MSLLTPLVYNVIDKFDLSENHFDLIFAFLKAGRHYDLAANEALWDNDLLSHVSSHMTCKATSLFCCLIQSYQRACPITAHKGSTQAAAQRRSLKNAGFQFQGGDSNYRGTYRINGIEYTKIIGYKKVDFNRTDMQPRLRSKFLAGKTCAFLPASDSCLEIDHRTPVARSLSLGLKPANFNEYYKQGAADLEFQSTCKSINSYKRETCKKCLLGNGKYDIYSSIPFGVDKSKFKQYQLPTTPTCEGCHWHNNQS